MVKRDKRYRFWYACYEAGITEPEAYIGQLYVNGMSGRELSEHFLKKYGLSTSPRNIEHYIKSMGISRSKSAARKIAIQRKRVIYKKNPEIARMKRKQISTKVRVEVLIRDEMKCVICGNGRHNGYMLDIHHIDGPESTEDNLQTLCTLCHQGIHAIEREAK